MLTINNVTPEFFKNLNRTVRCREIRLPNDLLDTLPDPASVASPTEHWHNRNHARVVDALTRARLCAATPNPSSLCDVLAFADANRLPIDLNDWLTVMRAVRAQM